MKRATSGNTPVGKPQKAKAPTKNQRPKHEIIATTISHHPDLSTRQIAKLCDTDHSYVIQVMQRYNIVANQIDDYKAHRANIFAGIQHRLLASITPEELQKTPVGSRILAACQLYDKERLECGQTTSNVGLGVALSPGLQELMSRVIDRDVIAKPSSTLPTQVIDIPSNDVCKK